MKFTKINTGNDNTSYWFETECFFNLGNPGRKTRSVRVDQVDYESTDPRSGMYSKRWEIRSGHGNFTAKTRAGAVAAFIATQEAHFAEYGV